MPPENSVQPDFVEFLKVLNEQKVEFVVIGGHAVGFHGHPRNTGDMDIVIRPTEENAARVVKAVAAFGAGELGYTKEDYLSGDFIQFGVVPVRIDVTTLFEGIDQQKLWNDAVEGTLGGVPVKFPSKECLLANKRSAGREKDLNDVKVLEATQVKTPESKKAKGHGFER
jgi:predicted nucleotidyltransferase